MASPFTPEQWDELRLLILPVHKLARIASELGELVMVLRHLLVKKGVITREEFDDAEKEFKAGIAVDLALHPLLGVVFVELMPLLEKLERQMEKGEADPHLLRQIEEILQRLRHDEQDEPPKQ